MGTCAQAPTDVSHHNIDEKTNESVENKVRPRILIYGRKEKLYGNKKYPLRKLNTVTFNDNIDIFCGYCTIVRDSENNLWHIGTDASKKNQDLNENDELVLTQISQMEFVENDEQNINISKLCISQITIITHWITDDGKLYELGKNYHHEQDPWTNPRQNLEIQNVIDVKSSRYFSIALCKGSDEKIRLILDFWTRQKQYLPSDIKGLIGIFHGISNKVYSMGNCLYGSNGQGINTNPSDSLQFVSKWTEINKFHDKNITKISIGSYHSLFLEDNGRIWCCGWNQRYLYDDTSGKSWQMISEKKRKQSDVSLPVPIKYFLKNKISIIEIECGSWHNLAIDSNHKIYSWGSSTFGQCGDRLTVGMTRSVARWYHPEIIPYFIDVFVDKIDCGYLHSYCRVIENMESKNNDYKHYLFGSNGKNECITFDDRISIDIPHCINSIINDKTDGMKIMSVHLGYENTKIILHPFVLKEQL